MPSTPPRFKAAGGKTGFAREICELQCIDYLLVYGSGGAPRMILLRMWSDGGAVAEGWSIGSSVLDDGQAHVQCGVHACAAISKR